MASASAAKSISPFRLCSLLRLEKNPSAALKLFWNPNPNRPAPQKPFRYSLLCYDVIITKLGRAKLFDELERVLQQLKLDTRIGRKEIIFCNVMNFYGRGRLPGRALQLFDEMPSFGCKRTVKSVNTLLNVLLKSGNFGKMREIIGGMGRFGRPDACTYNILINGCLKSQCFDDASKLFEEMAGKGVKPNGVTFGTLINGLCGNLKVKEALKMKADMLKVYGIFPTSHIYASLITALFRIGEFDLAFRLKDEMSEAKVKLDAVIYSTLIRWHFKIGRKEEVSLLLEEMRANGCKPDTVTYNVMIDGFCGENDFEAAFRVLDEMPDKDCKPDVISYNVILNALCKQGKWAEATSLFEDMPRRDCAPDVVSYRILFDGLCGAMQFQEAGCLLDEMVFKGYKPRSDSLNRFLESMSQKDKLNLVGRVLSGLEKGDARNADLWGLAVSIACEKDNLSHMNETIDSFMMERVDS